MDDQEYIRATRAVAQDIMTSLTEANITYADGKGMPGFAALANATFAQIVAMSETGQHCPHDLTCQFVQALLTMVNGGATPQLREPPADFPKPRYHA